MDPANAKRSDPELQDGKEVEVDDVKNLDRFVRTCRGETATVRTHTHALDLSVVCFEFFHEFDRATDFFPKLQNPVGGTGDKKVGEGCQQGESQLFAVHERL